jgi:hypothetical protein
MNMQSHKVLIIIHDSPILAQYNIEISNVFPLMSYFITYRLTTERHVTNLTDSSITAHATYKPKFIIIATCQQPIDFIPKDFFRYSVAS